MPSTKQRFLILCLLIVGAFCFATTIAKKLSDVDSENSKLLSHVTDTADDGDDLESLDGLIDVLESSRVKMHKQAFDGEAQTLPRASNGKMRGLRKISSSKGVSSDVLTAISKLQKGQGHGAVKIQWGFFRKVGRFFKKTWRKVKRVAKKVGRGVKKFAKKAWKGVKKVWKKVKHVAKKVGKGIKKVGKKAFKFVKKIAKKAWKGIKKFGKAAFKVVKRIGKAFWKGLKKIGKYVWKFAKSPIGQFLIKSALQFFGVPPMVSGPILTLITGGSPMDILSSMIPGGKFLKGGGKLLKLAKKGGVFKKVVGFIKGGGLKKVVGSLFKKGGVRKIVGKFIRRGGIRKIKSHAIRNLIRRGGLKSVIDRAKHLLVSHAKSAMKNTAKNMIKARYHRSRPRV
jgi:DNA-binding ferritin-like protein (Dps family)